MLSGPRDAAEAALAEVAAEIERLENLFSLHRPGSQLARLNRDGALAAPARDLTAALRLAAALARADRGRVRCGGAAALDRRRRPHAAAARAGARRPRRASSPAASSSPPAPG